jgi:hypothetical protein
MKKGDALQSSEPSSGKKWTTQARLRDCRNLAELAQGWEELEEWEREEWWKRARCRRVRIRRRKDPQADRKPKSRTMRGQELYQQINRVLGVCGYERRRLPPPPARFGANPITPDLKISFVKGRLSIKLVLRGVPTTDIMVYGSPPRRAGQMPGGNYAFLGLLPPLKDGECDISEMYENKLREWVKLSSAPYQVPVPGSRICILTWPQENGWEAKGLRQVSHGLAPRLGKRDKRPN